MLEKPGNFVSNYCLLESTRNHSLQVLNSSEREPLSRKQFEIHDTRAVSEGDLHQKVPGFVSLTPEEILT